MGVNKHRHTLWSTMAANSQMTIAHGEKAAIKRALERERREHHAQVEKDREARETQGRLF